MALLLRRALKLGNYKAFVALNLEEPIVVVSDLHLDGNHRDLTCIGRAVRRLRVATVIVNGDLFDSMRHLSSVSETMIRYSMARLGLSGPSTVKNFIYITSRGNHDPCVVEPRSFILDDVSALVVPEALLLKSGGRWFVIAHGDLLIRDGVLAALVELVMGRGFVEELMKSRLGLEKGIAAVLGHTHLPVAKDDVFNTGSWVSRLGIPSSDTLLLLVRGTATLVSLDCCNP